MGFRRRLLVLTTVLVAVMAAAGIAGALLFDRALDRVVTLESSSGKVLRAARDLQIQLLLQRGRVVELQYIPEGALRETALGQLHEGRQKAVRMEQELLDSTRASGELEALTGAFLEAVHDIRARSDAVLARAATADAALVVPDDWYALTVETEQAMDALIREVRSRQALQMRDMGAALDQRLLQLTLGFLAVVVAAGGVLFLFLDHYFAMPMARAIRIAGDVAAGRANQRIPVDRSDEFGVFAHAFNRMLEELTGINRRLAEANRELESFSYTISHDLRAPLRSISGFAEALREEAHGRLDAGQLDHLARIGAAAGRMSAMIHAMLELARIGRGELRGESLDLSQMAGEVIAELRAADPGRSVEVTIEPGIRAWGDAGLLRVVLDNLLGNAWKYTARAAQARIGFGRQADGGEAGFFVRDNGAGFDPAFATHLFRPFRRLHTEAEFEGTGIGLATVQRIVQRHGGRVQASAQPGRGACFEVLLPSEPVAGG